MYKNRKEELLGRLFPKDFWTGSFLYWWIVSLATVLMFDIFWMLQTTFRPFSYFAFWPVLFLSAFILALPSLFSRNGILQTLWLLFFNLLFVANLMYCRTYYNAIPLQSYGLVGNLADFKESVADSFKWYFIFQPLLTIGAFVYYLFSPYKSKKLPRLTAYPIYVFLLLFITWISDIGRGGTLKRMEFMANYAYLSSSITPIYSLGGYLIHDYYKTNEKLTPEQKTEVEDWLDYHRQLTSSYLSSGDSTALRKPKNLIVILCESLESWVINREVEGKELTPYINSLIADSTTFYAPHVVTQVGDGRSIDGQLLILTGLMPMINRAYAYNTTDNRFFSLPYAMKEENAASYLFTCDKPYVWNQALVAKAFGIDSLIHSKDFVIDETAGPSKRLSDGSFFRQIVGKLKEGKIWPEGSNVFLMAVTYSGHNPFKLPDHLKKLTLTGDYPEIIKNYMITANYTDSSLKHLIDYLKSRGDWEDTMVVITGDHEGLASDRKTALKNPASAGVVDPRQHTPLIILNSPVAGKYEKEMGQVDIYSTILDLLGKKDYPWQGLGFSVFDPAAPGIAVSPSEGLVGNSEKTDSLLIKHLQKARNISDLILKFNML